MDDQTEEFEFDGPSKSQVKREMTALQEMGTRLTELPESQLKQIPIENEQLLDAVMLARRLTARGGRRRQLQFIGKLMRKIDPAPIEDALARLDGRHEEEKARFHRLEQLRDGLLSQGDKGLDPILVAFPEADRQQLRQLYRQHQSQLSKGKPSAVGKKLFRYLRELEASSSGSVLAESSDSPDAESEST